MSERGRSRVREEGRFSKQGERGTLAEERGKQGGNGGRGAKLKVQLTYVHRHQICVTMIVHVLLAMAHGYSQSTASALS